MWAYKNKIIYLQWLTAAWVDTELTSFLYVKMRWWTHTWWDVTNLSLIQNLTFMLIQRKNISEITCLFELLYIR